MLISKVLTGPRRLEFASPSKRAGRGLSTPNPMSGIFAQPIDTGLPNPVSLQVPLIDDELEEDPELNWDEASLLHHVTRPKKNITYSARCSRDIQIAYLVAVIVWIIVIFLFNFYETDIIGYIILVIPIIVYGFNFVNVSEITKEVEEEMLRGNFLSFAFLVTIILINWSKIDNKGKYFKILFVALILLMLSLIYVWVRPERMPLERHIRTIFHTAALVLLVFALYTYYREVVNMPTTS